MKGNEPVFLESVSYFYETIYIRFSETLIISMTLANND